MMVGNEEGDEPLYLLFFFEINGGQEAAQWVQHLPLNKLLGGECLIEVSPTLDMEELALQMAVEQTYKKTGGWFRPWAVFGKGMGKIILMEDSDKIVPKVVNRALHPAYQQLAGDGSAIQIFKEILKITVSLTSSMATYKDDQHTIYAAQKRQ
ncbi:hypothetical protein CPB85DRAFT_1262797 [Mucidula mucida]|nr:hypothetical protein CPB85DRAFT_1262797 [Mucidula mucida]